MEPTEWLGKFCIDQSSARSPRGATLSAFGPTTSLGTPVTPAQGMLPARLDGRWWGAARPGAAAPLTVEADVEDAAMLRAPRAPRAPEGGRRVWALRWPAVAGVASSAAALRAAAPRAPRAGGRRGRRGSRERCGRRVGRRSRRHSRLHSRRRLARPSWYRAAAGAAVTGSRPRPAGCMTLARGLAASWPNAGPQTGHRRRRAGRLQDAGARAGCRLAGRVCRPQAC